MNRQSAIALPFLLICQLALTAQEKECKDADILAVKGAWEKSDFVTSFYEPQNREKYSRAYPIVQHIADLFMEVNPSPGGLEPKWWAAERAPVLTGAPLSYDFAANYMGYICSKSTGQLLLNFETGTWVNVHINTGGFVFRFYDTLKIRGIPTLIYQLPKRAGTWRDHPAFLQPDVGKYSTLGNVLILHRPDELPYIVLTREEFLLGLKDRLLRKKEEQLGTMDAMDKELAGKMELLKDLPAEYRDQIMENYKKSMEAYQQDKGNQKNKATEMFDEEIRKIEDYLSSTSEEDLLKPAITVNTDTFTGFFSRENEAARLMVRYNPDYFKKDLPPHTPQFIILFFRYDIHPGAAALKKNNDDHFPVEKVQALIDKP